MEPEHTTTRSELREQLIHAGLKATQQRIVILETLLALHGTHPHAEDIFQKLTVQNPGISLGTIYKTLDSLVAVGLIKKVLSEEGSMRYDSNCFAHGHIYCRRTKEIIDYTDPDLQKIMNDFFASKKIKNFQIKGISIQIIGDKTNPEDAISIT